MDMKTQCRPPLAAGEPSPARQRRGVRWSADVREPAQGPLLPRVPEHIGDVAYPQGVRLLRDRIERQLEGRCSYATATQLSGALERSVVAPQGVAGDEGVHVDVDFTALEARHVVALHTLPVEVFEHLKSATGKDAPTLALHDGEDVRDQGRLIEEFADLDALPVRLAWSSEQTPTGLPAALATWALDAEIGGLHAAVSAGDKDAIRDSMRALVDKAFRGGWGEALGGVIDDFLHGKSMQPVLHAWQHAVLAIEPRTGAERRDQLALLLAKTGPQPGAGGPDEGEPLLSRLCTRYSRFRKGAYKAIYRYVRAVLDCPHLHIDAKRAACLSVRGTEPLDERESPQWTAAELACMEGQHWAAAAILHAVADSGLESVDKTELIVEMLGIDVPQTIIAFRAVPETATHEARNDAVMRIWETHELSSVGESF